MTSLTTFLVFAVTTVGLAPLLIKGEDRQWVMQVMLIAWVCLFPLLVVVNFWFPFLGGGDDENYFATATVDFSSWAEILDLTRFVGVMVQPGYSALLSILYQFTGEDLLAFKLLNLAMFMLLIPVWCRIGLELDSRQFGRAMALAILLLTPLWNYWAFLLKDLVITLLQSIFLLGLVQISGRRSKGGWLLLLAATLALIPFRAPLVIFNLAAFAGTVGLMLIRRGSRGRSFTTAIISAIVIAGVLSIVTNPERMAALGMYSESSVAGSEESDATTSAQADSSLMNRELFPLLYLFTETSGLNPKTWSDFDGKNLRGVLAIPWILVAVPFFLVGLLWLTRRDPQTTQQGNIIARIQSSRLVTTPWGCLLIFILGYMAISWTMGDTTRWRLPDMPAMAAIAMAGWRSMAKLTRMRILMVWIGFTGGAFALFNLLRGV